MSGAWPPIGWFDQGAVEDAPVLWLPSKYAAAALDYTLDLTLAIQVGTDHITAVAAQVTPSGVGELTLTRMTAVDATHLLTLYLAGGQPGRTYTIPITVTMSDGRVPVFLARIRISPQLATDQPLAPPSLAYGPIVNAVVT